MSALADLIADLEEKYTSQRNGHEQLLRAWYEAKKSLINERSGDISGDTRRLYARAVEYSILYDFSFEIELDDWHKEDEQESPVMGHVALLRGDPVVCPECGQPVWDRAFASKLAKCWNTEGHKDGGTLAFDTMEAEEA